MVELEDGVYTGVSTYCLASEFPNKLNGQERKSCDSSDALAIYEKEDKDGHVTYDATCYSCMQYFNSKEVHTSSLAPSLGIDEGEVRDRVNFENKSSKKEKITTEERKSLWEHTEDSVSGYRSHNPEVLKFYGHRFSFTKDGELDCVWYPETSRVDGKLQGYKSRGMPKDFYRANIGKTGVSSQLSGQHRFPEGGKVITIVAGEEDKCAVQTVLMNYQKSKGSGYSPYAVVSPTTGEGSCAKQCQQEYEYLNSFEIIKIGMDNDEAGREALAEMLKVLPKKKIQIITWSDKDPNNMTKDGKNRQVLSDWFNAKPVVESGVFNGDSAMIKGVIKMLKMPRIALPPHLKGLEVMTRANGILPETINSIIGDTSVGKTTLVNSLLQFWMFNLSQHKVGVVSLEAKKEAWVAEMLSSYLGNNLYWLPQDEIESYLEAPENEELINNFFYTEQGEPRFSIVDDREGTVDSLEDCLTQLYRGFGCTIIVNDVLTDVLRVEDNDKQAMHFNWQSNLIKDGPTIFNVLHTSKPPKDRSGRPSFPSEYDAYGNSIFVQKAASNIIIARNKTAPEHDWIERNSTYMKVPKLRQGDTGDGPTVFYDGETKRSYDRNQYFKDNPEKLPEGYDLTVSSFEEAYWEEGGRGFKGTPSDGKFNQKKSKKDVKPIIPSDSFKQF